MATRVECDKSDSGILYVGTYTFTHSSASDLNKSRKTHGVVVCLNKLGIEIWKAFESIWTAINSRIVMVCLKYKPINVIIIAVHVPVNQTSGQTEETEPFYDNRQEVSNDTSF